MITLTTEQAQQIEESLESCFCYDQNDQRYLPSAAEEALATIRAARAQEQAEQEHFMCEPVPPISEEGWTDWVCPKPKGYLMQCCDCGLIHEVDSRVAKYDPMPSEEFTVVEDQNMQCQWRVRRRDDLATTQPVQQEPVLKALQLAEEALLSYKDITTKQWDEAIAAIRVVKDSLTVEPFRFGCLYPGGRLEVFNTRERAQKYVDGTLRNGGDVKLVELYAAPVRTKDLSDDENRLKRIAAIAHCGGLANMSVDDALTVIRKITLPYFDREASDEKTRAVIAAYREKNK